MLSKCSTTDLLDHLANVGCCCLCATQTATLYPGVVFSICFVLNCFIWGEHSSGAVSLCSCACVCVCVRVGVCACVRVCAHLLCNDGCVTVSETTLSVLVGVLIGSTQTHINSH